MSTHDKRAGDWLQALWHEAVYEPTEQLETAAAVRDRIVDSLELNKYWPDNNCLISYGGDLITIEDDYGTHYTITIIKNN